MSVFSNSDDRCRHKWKKVDKDDSFTRIGRYKYKRVYERCIRCGEERIRKVKKRAERSDIHGKKYY